MTTNERVRTLRKELLKLTMEEFGSRVAVSKSAISLIERGENNVSDRMVKSICREFNVSEAWLRDGVGEPFLTMDRDDEIMAIMGQILSEDSSRHRYMALMCKLTPEEWELLEKMCRKVFGDKKED